MPVRNKISPWIEKLIGSYGSDEGTSAGQLKAHVIGVGPMSQSQAQGSEGPTVLLFLSDEQVQIPAVLTDSAWEDLQEQEDRECFSSLLNTTVCIQDYSLLFHMAPEQTRCKFYLSVGKLATIVVGSKSNTPCCTSLPSVRMKIYQTWRLMLSQGDSQKSQTGFDLTDLLGEWQHDCLKAELEHVKEKLSTVTPQPSTSTMNPTVSLSDTCTATTWDMERVRYKGLKSFTVPIQQLLMPDSLRQLQQQQQPNSAQSVSEAERDTSSGTNRSQASAEPEDTTGQQCASGSSPIPQEDPPVVLCGDSSPMSNPWDMFPSPSSVSSSSTSSPEDTPVPDSPILTTLNPPLVTSTQRSTPGSKVSQTKLTAEHSKTGHSLFPPYQRPNSAQTHSTSSFSFASSGESTNALSSVSQAADPNCSTTTQKTSTQEPKGKRKALRKRSALPLEPLQGFLKESKVKQISSSPPSWLLDSQVGSTFKGDSPQPQRHIVKKPSVHSNGNPFRYTYNVSDQDFRYFSCFTVGQSQVQWAVRYLLGPQHTEDKSAGAAAHKASDSHVTLL